MKSLATLALAASLGCAIRSPDYLTSFVDGVHTSCQVDSGSTGSYVCFAGIPGMHADRQATEDGILSIMSDYGVRGAFDRRDNTSFYRGSLGDTKVLVTLFAANPYGAQNNDYTAVTSLALRVTGAEAPHIVKSASDSLHCLVEEQN